MLQSSPTCYRYRYSFYVRYLATTGTCRYIYVHRERVSPRTPGSDENRNFGRLQNSLILGSKVTHRQAKAGRIKTTSKIGPRYRQASWLSCPSTGEDATSVSGAAAAASATSHRLGAHRITTHHNRFKIPTAQIVRDGTDHQDILNQATAAAAAAAATVMAVGTHGITAETSTTGPVIAHVRRRPRPLIPTADTARPRADQDLPTPVTATVLILPTHRTPERISTMAVGIMVILRPARRPITNRPPYLFPPPLPRRLHLRPDTPHRPLLPMGGIGLLPARPTQPHPRHAWCPPVVGVLTTGA